MAAVSAANIIITQSGVAGGAGRSRNDIVLAQQVTLSNEDNSGVRSWRWVLVDRPPGSTATITNPTSAVAYLTPDVAGSYLVELTVDEGRKGQVTRRVVAVLENISGFEVRFPAAGEKDEANWDDGTGSPNERGWMPDLVDAIRASITGGTIDGDQLIIDYTPTNYTPDTSPPEVTLSTHLTAHLAGIDAALLAADELADGSAVNSTLRWDGADWVENTTVLTSSQQLSVGTDSSPGTTVFIRKADTAAAQVSWYSAGIERFRDSMTTSETRQWIVYDAAGSLIGVPLQVNPTTADIRIGVTAGVLEMWTDILPNTGSTHDVGAVGATFLEGHFDNLYLGGTQLGSTPVSTGADHTLRGDGAGNWAEETSARITASGEVIANQFLSDGAVEADLTNKLARYLGVPYNLAQQNIAVALMDSQVALSRLLIGGGSPSYQAATDVRIYAAAAVGTATGTQVAGFNTSDVSLLTPNVTIGSVTGAGLTRVRSNGVTLWDFQSNGDLIPGSATQSVGNSTTRVETVFLGVYLDMAERASVGAPAAGAARWWVESTAPNLPKFTDDSGVAHTLAYSTGGAVSIAPGTVSGTMLAWDGVSAWTERTHIVTPSTGIFEVDGTPSGGNAIIRANAGAAGQFADFAWLTVDVRAWQMRKEATSHDLSLTRHDTTTGTATHTLLSADHATRDLALGVAATTGNELRGDTWGVPAASAVFELGDGTGGPRYRIYKADSVAAYPMDLWSNGFRRWLWQFDTAESLLLGRYDATGVFTDVNLQIDTDGDWTAGSVGRNMELQARSVFIGRNTDTANQQLIINSPDAFDAQLHFRDAGTNRFSQHLNSAATTMFLLARDGVGAVAHTTAHDLGTGDWSFPNHVTSEGYLRSNAEGTALNLAGDSPLVFIGSGVGSGSPQVFQSKGAGVGSYHYMRSGTVTDADGNFRWLHTAAETFGLQAYFGATWNDVWSVASASDTVTFHGNVVIGGVTQTAGLADGTQVGALNYWSGSAWVEETTIRREAANTLRVGVSSGVIRVGDNSDTITYSAGTLSLIRGGGNSVSLASNIFRPDSATITLGGPSNRWIDVYGVTGNFSTDVLIPTPTSVALNIGGTSRPPAGADGIRYTLSDTQDFYPLAIQNNAGQVIWNWRRVGTSLDYELRRSLAGVLQGYVIYAENADPGHLWLGDADAAAEVRVRSRLYVTDIAPSTAGAQFGVAPSTGSVAFNSGNVGTSQKIGGHSDTFAAVVATSGQTASWDLSTQDGARMMRTQLFLTDDATEANRAFGLWHSWASGGSASFVVGYTTSEWQRFDPDGNAYFPNHDLTILRSSALYGAAAIETHARNWAVVGGHVDTDITDKYIRFGGLHRTNSEEPVVGLMVASESANNRVSLGGGTSVGNAATRVEVWLAGNTTTVTGTEEWRWEPGEMTSIPGSRLNVGGGLGTFEETWTVIEAYDGSGGLLVADSITDLTAKTGRWGVPHYNNSVNGPFVAFMPVSGAADNVLHIGGGTGLGTAATIIAFRTAANNTTVTGTEQWRIDDDGDLTSIAGKRFNVGGGLESFEETTTIIEGYGASGDVMIANSRADATDKSFRLLLIARDTSLAPREILEATSTTTEDPVDELWIGGGFPEWRMQVSNTDIVRVTSGGLLPGTADTYYIGEESQQFESASFAQFVAIGEQASITAPSFGFEGRFWVENTSPNVPKFTDGDAGVHTLAYLDPGVTTLPSASTTGSSLAYNGGTGEWETQSNVLINQSAALDLYLSDSSAQFYMGNGTGSPFQFMRKSVGGAAYIYFGDNPATVASVNHKRIAYDASEVFAVENYSTAWDRIFAVTGSAVTIGFPGTSWTFADDDTLAGVSGSRLAVGRSTFVKTNSLVEGYGQNGMMLASSSDSDLTAKTSRWGVLHQTNSEEPFLGMVLVSDGTDNIASIGGGSSLGNAATEVRLMAAANDTTTSGSTILTVNTSALLPLDGVAFGDSTHGVSEVHYQETGTAPTTAAGGGATWDQNSTPSTHMYTDDAGNDHPLSLMPEISFSASMVDMSHTDGGTVAGDGVNANCDLVEFVGSGRVGLEFTDGVTESGTFTGHLPASYSGNGLTVQIMWTGSDANTSTVDFEIAFERIQDGTTTMSADSWDETGAQSASIAGPNPAYVLDRDTFVFTDSQIDGLQPGEQFRIAIRRYGSADSYAATVYVTGVRIYETNSLADAA